MIGFALMVLRVAPLISVPIGMPRDCLSSQLGAWRTGGRHALAPDCMAHTAQRLAATEIGAISQWMAAQPVPLIAKPAAASAAALPGGGVFASVAVGDSKR